MEEQLFFKDYAIVACGMLAPELNYLRKQDFLDAKKIVYTTSGWYEVLKELESQDDLTPYIVPLSFRVSSVN